MKTFALVFTVVTLVFVTTVNDTTVQNYQSTVNTQQLTIQYLKIEALKSAEQINKLKDERDRLQRKVKDQQARIEMLECSGD